MARHFRLALGETQTRKAGHEICVKVDIVAFFAVSSFWFPARTRYTLDSAGDDLHLVAFAFAL